MKTLRIGIALVALAALVLASAPTAAAHASANSADGKYRITWGLLDEPGFTHQKNRLDLIVRENATGAGVGGLTAENLTVTLHYGEEEYDLGDISAYRGAKGANAGAGNYTSANPVYLTRPGVYVLHVEGNILGTPVDLEIPAAHAYESMSDIAFPDEHEFGSADTSDLEARIAALEQEVAALKAEAQAQSTTPATVTSGTGGSPVPGPALALVGLAVVAAALVARRKA